MNENGLVDQEQYPLRKQPPKNLVTIAWIVYVLQALSVVIGAFSGVTIANAFIFGWPSIVGVILNYVKRKEAEGTYIATHFTWQITTFWWAVALVVIVWVLSLALAFLVVGLLIPNIGYIAIAIWVVYRIVRGWLNLNDGKPMVLK
ncbi:MAG: hypothetical protein LUC43_06275 [Burkholderiales bacterium]|nr:hypothetical protein [Burkholderiales bacterium]